MQLYKAMITVRRARPSNHVTAIVSQMSRSRLICRYDMRYEAEKRCCTVKQQTVTDIRLMIG